MQIFIGGILGIFLMTIGFYLEGGNLAILIQGTAMIVTFGGALGALLISYPWGK